MLSLAEKLGLLERDLLANPPRTFVYSDLPFALLRYDPDEEWPMRRQVRELAARLGGQGRCVEFISLAELLWQAIDACEGLDVLAEYEADRGFAAAQAQVTTYLTRPRWRPLAQLLEHRLAGLDSERAIAFLWRAAALSPALYPLSKLLSEMIGRTRVLSVLFYPGTPEGEAGMCYMGLPDREAMGSYRVKVYS